MPLKVTAGRRCFSSACELTRAAECLHEGLFPRQTCERWSIQDVYDNRILNGPCSRFRCNFFLPGILNPKVSDGHSYCDELHQCDSATNTTAICIEI